MPTLHVLLMNHMLKRRLLSLIYPVRCPICGKIIFPHEDFCNECHSDLPKYCGNFSITGAEAFVAPFEYTDKISPAILLMKDGIKGNAPYALGHATAECIKNHGIHQQADIIIPTPLYSADKRKRGFNQSELIAKEVGRILNINVCTNCIEKVRITKSQKQLSKNERKNNLKDAFAVKSPELIQEKRIMLIDDVCTTGSTLAELTKTLRQTGASAVYCVCCCKTPIKKDDKND